jgi:hypothetical protein
MTAASLRVIQLPQGQTGFSFVQHLAIEGYGLKAGLLAGTSAPEGWKRVKDEDLSSEYETEETREHCALHETRTSRTFLP